MLRSRLPRQEQMTSKNLLLLKLPIKLQIHPPLPYVFLLFPMMLWWFKIHRSANASWIFSIDTFQSQNGSSRTCSCCLLNPIDTILTSSDTTSSLDWLLESWSSPRYVFRIILRFLFWFLLVGYGLRYACQSASNLWLVQLSLPCDDVWHSGYLQTGSYRTFCSEYFFSHS